MNPVGFVVGVIAAILIDTPLKKLVLNDAYVKLMIITGALKWYDVPHLHHPLIHKKIDLEWRREKATFCEKHAKEVE